MGPLTPPESQQSSPRAIEGAPFTGPMAVKGAESLWDAQCWNGFKLSGNRKLRPAGSVNPSGIGLIQHGSSGPNPCQCRHSERCRRPHTSTERSILTRGGRSGHVVRTESVQPFCRPPRPAVFELHASSRAFTDLGFPVSPNTTPNPAYSQCRFTLKSLQSEIRLIINANLSKAPLLSIQAGHRTEQGLQSAHH
jgi:hypothetical protein